MQTSHLMCVRITSTRSFYENISAGYAALNHCHLIISYTSTLNCEKIHHLRLSPSAPTYPSVALFLLLIILYLSFVTKVTRRQLTLTLSKVIKHLPTHLQKKPFTLILPFHSHTLSLRLSLSLSLFFFFHTHTHKHTHI